MTAIAYDGKSIAADSLWTSGDHILGYKTKIGKYNHGVWTSCGRISDAELFRQWLDGEIRTFKPHKDFGGLFTKDGKVYEVDDTLVPFEAFIPTALGDGYRIMQGVLRNGGSAYDAVLAAVKNNVWCGGEVTVVDV